MSDKIEDTVEKGLMDIESERRITLLGNPRKPEGEEGGLMLERMNRSHTPVTTWALSLLPDRENPTILDIGCGGGNTLRLLSEKYPDSRLYGIDYSPVSVAKSIEYNHEDVEKGKLQVTEGSVADMPYEEGSFDLITTVESFYFWPEPVESLKEVRRVLKKNGTFYLIADIYEKEGLPEEARQNILRYHLLNPTPEEFRSLFGQAGFREIRIHLFDGEDWICVEGKN